MKRYLKITLVLLLLCLLGYLGYSIMTKINEKHRIEEQTQHIPSFSFTDLAGKKFSNKNLLPGTDTVFVYFNSECVFCQNEARQIQEHLSEFNRVQWVFVSEEDTKTIKKFAESYNLSDYDHVDFVHDPTSSFVTAFGVSNFPFLAVYNSKGELLQKFKGQTSPKAVLALFSQY